MKRSEFLKRLGLGAVAVAAAPVIAREVKEAFPEAVEKPEIKGQWVEGADHVYDGSEADWRDLDEAGKFSHYEEPWIHKVGWPFRINDQILLPNEKVYVVTALKTGGIYGENAAICTPMDARDPEITLTEENGKNVVIFGNLKSQL